VARLNEAAAARGLGTPAWVADMRRFESEKRYALVAVPFNAFAHCLDAADQIAALTCCRRALAPGGRVVLDVMHPSQAWDVAADGERSLEIETRDPATGRPVRFYETRIRDRIAQRLHSRYDVELLADDGAIVPLARFETTFRWWQRPEMELLLRLAGFTRWEIAGEFDGRPLTADGAQMVVSAWADPA
jgi:SAM-dependent methyltransferase